MKEKKTMIRSWCTEKLPSTIFVRPQIYNISKIELHDALLNVPRKAFLTLEGVGLKPASVSAPGTISQAFKQRFLESINKNKCGNL